jgi:hypothetical protein
MDNSEVNRLLALADTLAPPGESTPSDKRWHEEITHAPTETLVGLAGNLNSEPGKPAAKRKALREAVMAEIERKNAEQITKTLRENTEKITKTMRDLDNATNKLNKTMLCLTVFTVILTLVQVVFALLQFTPK